MSAKYLNPYTDFGFKRLFGEEASRELLIDFLNQLLPTHHQVAELSFKSPEKLPSTSKERKAIFDIYCHTQDGQRFIVEMQKARLNFFKDRALFYSTFPIKEQARKGIWNFELMPVYCIAILNFRYDETEEIAKFRRDVCLKDQDGDVFFDKLHFKFLQMPLFNKQEHELTTHFDKWVYFLKHLETLDHIPAILNEPIFQKGFEIAELAQLSPKQFDAYQKSLLEYWDVENVSETAFEDGLNKGLVKGLAQGRIEGKIEGKIEGQREAQQAMAKTMLVEGLSAELIAKITGLSLSDIQQLNANL